jgi:hypothetical protein
MPEPIINPTPRAADDPIPMVGFKSSTWSSCPGTRLFVRNVAPRTSARPSTVVKVGLRLVPRLMDRDRVPCDVSINEFDGGVQMNNSVKLAFCSNHDYRFGDTYDEIVIPHFWMQIFDQRHA